MVQDGELQVTKKQCANSRKTKSKPSSSSTTTSITTTSSKDPQSIAAKVCVCVF